MTGGGHPAGDWQPALVVRCACGHPSEDHDRVASRYCAATVSGRLDRGCVCLPVHDFAVTPA